jgi:hypothetical protein
MKRLPSRFVFLAAALFVFVAATGGAASPDIVISQVYGGGGNSGATLRNDFIELFNRGPSAVSVTGWSVQYGSSAGTTWQVTAISGTIQPGQYYLVQEAAGAGGTTDLPTPDATGAIAMSATAGKVALVTNTTALPCGSSCATDANVRDFVGYGTTANNFEGAGPTPAPSNTAAVLRASNGCTDTDNNAADFAAGAPNPRNSSTVSPCGAPTNPSGVGAANPSSVLPGGTTLLTVTVTPGANPTSTGLAVTADLTPIGGSATQSFFDDGTNGDATPNDSVFSFQTTVSVATTPGAKSLPFSISDAQARSGSGSIALTVTSTVIGSQDIVISEFRVRGPSGGSDEFIELYNLSTNPVSIGGWKIRGSNNTGTAISDRAVIPAGVTLPADCHYLLTNSSTSGGPYSGAVTGNQTYSIGIADDGGIAVTLPDNTVVDQVGMSVGSAFKEGTPLVPLAGNLNRGYERKPGGASGSTTDTDNNADDFQLISPSDPQNGLVPTGIGSATPPSVLAGDSTLLQVAVNPVCNSTNAGTTVVADLSSIGGSAAQAFFDDGTNGDSTSGDGTYSYLATVPAGTGFDDLRIQVRVTDDLGRTGSLSIALSVQPPPVEIFQIQGAALASPFVGTTVTTRDNVVTAIVSNGFFIQTPVARADADPQTSNGVFVFTSSAPTVSVGDQVDVSGTVSEFFDMTEVDASSVTVDSSGNALPPPFTFDTTTPSPNQPQPATEMERFEGMLVRVVDGTVSSPTNQFGEASVVAAPQRAFREPGIAFPGLTGLPVWDGNPEIFEIDTDRFAASPGLRLAGGATVTAEGPLAFSFSDYQIWPTSLEFTGDPEVVPVRARVAGEFTVGGQNFLRLFDTVDDGATDDPIPTPQQYEDRLTKFSLHVRVALGAPDVLAVQEVENLEVLQDVADRIQVDDPSLSYTPYLVEGNDIGGIDVGFLVRDTVQVDSIEQFGKDDLFTFGGTTAPLNDRPPLILHGAYVGNGAPFPIVVIDVHQRSLSGIDGSDGPRVRAKRNAQALRLSELIQSLQEEPGLRLLVIGDFNAFEFTDGYVDVMGQVTGIPDPGGALIPVTPLVSPSLTNQTFNMPEEERYSFVFDGTAQSLDHAITTQALDPFVRGAHHTRGNADAPFAFDTDATTPLRSSDHDGTVVFIMSDSDADGVPDDGDSCAGSSPSATVVIDGCDSGAANDVFSDGCKITDRIDDCAASAVTHEDFTACVTQLTSQLKRDGFITNKEKADIQKCAGKADIP